MNVSKIVTLVAPLAVALCALPALVHAQGHGGACRQDIQQLCPDITSGPGAFEAVHQCLQDNAANLSLACQQELAARQARMEQTLQPCQSDIQTLCSDAGADPPAIFECLYQDRDNLSQTCRQQLPQLWHHRRWQNATPVG